MKTPRPLTRLAGLTVALAASSASAQTAATGPYYATPSWDQTMPASTRFVVLSNFASAAVLDRETGLIWQRAPSTISDVYTLAYQTCTYQPIGGRYGWRLPNASELASLFDPTVTSGPLLPAGHPFTVTTNSALFWTTSGTNSDKFGPTREVTGWGTVLGTTVISQGTLGTTQIAGRWCVRGPGDPGANG